jgi:hypothetical protein
MWSSQEKKRRNRGGYLIDEVTRSRKQTKHEQTSDRFDFFSDAVITND